VFKAGLIGSLLGIIVIIIINLLGQLGGDQLHSLESISIIGTIFRIFTTLNLSYGMIIWGLAGDTQNSGLLYWSLNISEWSTRKIIATIIATLLTILAYAIAGVLIGIIIQVIKFLLPRFTNRR
jgi:hypothetical protein